MLKKYRIYELSKDFNVSNKEIIEVLKSKIGGSYNHMTSLKTQELDLIFNHYTKKFEVKDFNDYFDLSNKQIDSEKIDDKNINDNKKEVSDAVIRHPVEEVKKDELLPQKKEEKIRPIIIQKQQIKRVNTRSESIDISKYDKKYEAMASQTNYGNSLDYVNKQKINRSKNKNFRKHESESERLNRIKKQRESRPIHVLIPDDILVSELASRLKVTSSELIKKLTHMGVKVSVDDSIDFDTASLVSMEFNAIVEKEIIKSVEEIAIDDTEDSESDLVPRSPVVVVMGHVDHGKTSILDYIRKSNVASRESGGITQHIGAYKASVNGKYITFLDTPGHEAFTSMRARGAKATDIAVLVVAADDGIMPQTVEAINHAKDAAVSIIVAINKIDKPGADIDKVKRQLMNYNLVPEEWGGDIVCVPVSAKTGEGISDLLDSILLIAEMKELKANPNRKASGVVIESKVESGRGVVSTFLVTNGSLHIGDIVVAGISVGKVRSMNNELGKKVKIAVPSDAVEITGLNIAPDGGDKFNVVDNDKLAHQLVDQRKVIRDNEKFGMYQKVNANNIFDMMSRQDMKELKVIIKADTNGSVEALRQSLEKLSNDEIVVNPIHCAVGIINESDVMLAKASDAVIVGFNVKVNSLAQDSANSQKIVIKLYKIIYDCINDMNQLVNNMLIPETKEVHAGSAECRKIFNIKGVGTIAGCYVTDGLISRGSLVHVKRNNEIVADDKIVSLKKYKDDVKEAAQGYECGILLEKYSAFEVDDIIECYKIEEVEK